MLRTVFGLDRHVYTGWLASTWAIGPSILFKAVHDVSSAREILDPAVEIMDSRFWPCPEVSWSDREIRREDGDAVPIRVYRKQGSNSRAIIVYAHGGGYISGNLDGYNRRCAAYVQATGIPLISVGYRLAPEYPFPHAHDDVRAVIQDVHANAELWGVDRDRIGIAGDSAGGGIAAGVALRLRDEASAISPRLACQLLIYPGLDDRTLVPDPADPNTRSRWISWNYEENAVAWSAYLGRRDQGASVSYYAAPARAKDFTGLPPTFISVGTLEILRREDELYACALRESGVPVEFRLIDAVQHGFDFIAPKAPVVVQEWEARFTFLTRHLEQTPVLD